MKLLWAVSKPELQPSLLRRCLSCEWNQDLSLLSDRDFRKQRTELECTLIIHQNPSQKNKKACIIKRTRCHWSNKMNCNVYDNLIMFGSKFVRINFILSDPYPIHIILIKNQMHFSYRFGNFYLPFLF